MERDIISIEIAVELMGALRFPSHLNDLKEGQRKFTLLLPLGSTINDLLERLNFSVQDRQYIITFVNKVRVNHVHKLNNNSKVFITLPVGGG